MSFDSCKRFALIGASLMLVGTLLGCAPVEMPAQADPTATSQAPEVVVSPSPAPVEPTAAPAMPDATVTPGGLELPVLVPSAEPPVVGDVPGEIMARVMADIEQRAGAQNAAPTILRSEAVVWNDGSLGCPQPGIFYTQALVEGYWLILQVGSTTYDYRIGGTQQVVLCPPGGPSGGAPGALPPTQVLIAP